MNIPSKGRWKDILTKVLIYLIILYTFFMLGRSIYLNYQLKKQAEEIKREIAKIEKQNKDFQNLILYYKSESFREVEARRKLDLKKLGETVVILPKKEARDFTGEIKADEVNVSAKSETKIEPNYVLWWRYFVK